MARKKWWQFWKKEQPLNLVDPIIAAYFPLDPLFSRKKPFSDWKPPDMQVPPEREDFIKAMVYGYQLFTHLQLIEAKFGPEITRIIREYQIIVLNRLPDGEVGKQHSLLLQIITDAWKEAKENPIKVPDRPDFAMSIEVTMAVYLLAFVKDSPYYVPPEYRVKDSILDHVPPKVDWHDLEWTLAECLEQGRNAALEVFGPIVQFIELKPETVSSLRRPEPGQKADKPRVQLVWSKNPGCYERHLRRKYQNPLFPPASRVVTQEEIDAARIRDLRDAEALREEFQHMLTEIGEISSSGSTKISTINNIREKIIDLMEKATSIGGDSGDEIEASLAEYLSALMSDCRSFFQNRGDSKSLELLDEAERIYEEKIKPLCTKPRCMRLAQ